MLSKLIQLSANLYPYFGNKYLKDSSSGAEIITFRLIEGAAYAA